MPRKPSLTFANLICHFGPKLVLLDLAEEIVMPAFSDEGLIRRFGKTSYQFLNVGYSVLRQGNKVAEVLLFGQHVKDTLLIRDQVLELGHLVASRRSIASAPSAFFVLMLSNHKIIYCPEMSGAPPIEAFASTVEHFLKYKHTQYLDKVFTDQLFTETQTTRAELLDRVPVPDVNIVPLASRDSIDEFIDAIEKLTYLEFRVLRTNREYQGATLYEQMRTKGEELEGDGKLIYANSRGMNKAEVSRQLGEAAASGNQKVVVAGLDANGSRVRGSNKEFKVQIDAPVLEGPPREKAFRLLREFERQSANGTLNVDATGDMGDQLERLGRTLRRDV